MASKPSISMDFDLRPIKNISGGLLNSIAMNVAHATFVP
jgi:hypothetical protein